jgi:hypothetical protein
MDAKLICYTLGEVDATTRSSFKRELNGYKDISNNGGYNYQRKGLLQSIPHQTPIRSVIIVSDKDKKKITELLGKYNATYYTYSIKINHNQLK